MIFFAGGVNGVNGVDNSPEQFYSMNPLTQRVDNLSETLTQNMSLEPGAAATAVVTNGGGGTGDGAEHRQTGKRSQKDANLDSGRLVVPYQESKTTSDSTISPTSKPNLSQQSSLNTPTVSEQLTTSHPLANVSQVNLAGGALNNF